MSTQTPKLKIWTAISVVVGCVIGSGVFVKPGRVLVAAGDSNSALLAWTIGGLISLAGGLTLAEIASRIPKTGGIYVYMEELYGKTWGFVCGWVQSLIYGPALMSALSLYFASLLGQFIGLSPETSIRPIALATLLLLAGVSAYSTAYGAIIQNVTTFIKLIPIILIAAAGMAMGDAPIFDVALSGAVAPTAGMGVAILATLWAYDGWVQVANLAGELENPSKNLPKAIVLGLVGVMAAYLLVNMALFHVVPVQEIATLNEKTAAVAATTLFGTIGGSALALGILVSIFGCLNGNILTMTRVPYAMALRGAFPQAKVFALLHPKLKTPVNSILLKTSIAMLMIVLLNPDRITDLAMFIMYLFYASVFFGIVKTRKTYGKPAKGEYKVPLYPVVPAVACAGSLYICFSMASQQPVDALISVLIALSGVPMYALMNRSKVEAPAVVQVP